MVDERKEKVKPLERFLAVIPRYLRSATFDLLQRFHRIDLPMGQIIAYLVHNVSQIEGSRLLAI